MPRKLRAELMSRSRLGPSATTRWINVSSSPNISATAPGAITVPAASSHTRPAKVSKSTITVTSGAGRLPSAGAVRARVAISTRASWRRCAAVRARCAAVVSSPWISLAAAQSAANSSRSIRANAPFTAAVATGVR